MSYKLRWLGFVVLISLAAGWYSVQAQTGTPPTDERRYFPQRGHWISKDFLNFYLAIPNPEEIYGYPITEAFHDQQSSRIIQYFERARFELWPENPPELRVKLTELGAFFHQEAGQELPVPPNFPACRLIQETGKQICYAFLDFYDLHGGAAQFGYPISNFETQEDLIVQYFQRARFEWHPEFPTGQRVRITDLGYRYFKKNGEDPMRLPPDFLGTDDLLLHTVLSLRVRAFPLQAVLPKSGVQTVYIVVQDQNLVPVPGAQVVLVVRLPSGREDRYIVPQITDKNGVTSFSFNYSDPSSGVAEVIVSAVFQNFHNQSITSFRIWY